MMEQSGIGKMKAMCSRNNNFSNRGQKLTMYVLPVEKENITQGISLESNNERTPYGIIVPSVISGIIGGMLLVGAIYYRNSLYNKAKNIRKK